LSRRRRTTASTKHAAPLPLFAWAARHQRSTTTAGRIVLRDDLRDAEGTPRACLTIPGRRLPLAFPNIPAALAALARMEAAHACR
jgi:plasmid stability protein